jgi:putative PIN family toxin of toxin-antitoxin system
MSSSPRFVLDSNVIVSGLLFPDSLPGQAFTEARTRGNILLSDDAVEELVDVLRRPKFDHYLLPEERDRFLATLIRQSIHVAPIERISVCRDSKDDKWIELAVAGNSSCLITGDQDLLELHGYRGIAVVTPAEFIRSRAEEKQ